jgi:hypothetical protein
MTVRLIAAAVLAVLLLAGPAPARAATRPLDLSAVLHPLDTGGDTLRQAGTFTGAPLGPGSARIATKVGAGDGASVTFELFNRHGKVRGSANVTLQFKGTTIIYRGTAKITSGTGSFATMRATGLKLAGQGPISGETFKVRITGSVTS